MDALFLLQLCTNIKKKDNVTYCIDNISAYVMVCVQLFRTIEMKNGNKNTRMSVKEILLVLHIPRFVQFLEMRQLSKSRSRLTR